jgi:hypothetical protein
MPLSVRLHPLNDRQQDSRRVVKKSNFTELSESPVQASLRIKATHMQATLFMSLGLKPYSQWFKVYEHKVADALSCNDDRRDEELTNIIKSLSLSQVSSHFKI